MYLPGIYDNAVIPTFYNRQTYAPDYATDNFLRMVFAASCPYGEGDPSLLEKVNQR